MMKFFFAQGFGKAQPELVEQGDFLGCQVGSMGSQVKHALVPAKRTDQPAQPQPIPRDRAKRLDPRTRPAVLMLGRDQFKLINKELFKTLLII